VKRIFQLILTALALSITILIVWSKGMTAENGMVRTTYPTMEDPGPPFYARIVHQPPHFLHDGEWAAIVFYREPNCVPADFNLLLFFDSPAAFACPLTVKGANLWEGEPHTLAPKIAISTGSGLVPVWFVPLESVNNAIRDSVMTIGELAGLEGRLVGSAKQFDEELHPSPLPPELGGGGHSNPKLIQNAHGQLEDGRVFNLHVTELRGEVKSIQIRFR
jgi:hypothetical protein